MSQIVVIAIDDNDRAWYEMLVPFFTSLRATDYAGRCGVISYGLSQRKRHLLEADGIAVFEGDKAAPLSSNRYISAMKIIRDDASLDALALYDADIWFPGPHFTLFSALTNAEDIHVCADSQASDFIFNPVLPEAGDLRERCRLSVLHQFPVQAGLVIGARKAWIDFAGHVEDCLGRRGIEFQDIYGLDTTILQLWVGADRARQIDRTHNFVAKWGVHERHDYDRGVVLEHDGTPIHALHMTRDVRYRNAWRYLSREEPKAFPAALPLCLVEREDWGSLELGSEARDLVQTRLGTRLDVIRAPTAMDPNLVVCRSLLGRNGITVGAWRALDLELTTLRRLALDFIFTFADGHPSALSIEVDVDGDRLIRHAPTFEATIWVDTGRRIRVRATALPGQMCHTLIDLAARDA